MKIFDRSTFFALSCVFVFHLPLSVHTRRLETDFVLRNGNEPNSLEPWKLVRNWFNATNGTELVKEYCQEAHKKYGLGEDTIIESVSLTRSNLTFRSPKFKPMFADILTYGIDSKCIDPRNPQKNRKYWHIMEGQRTDCVWYLEPVNENATEFELREHVYYVKY